MRAVHIIVALSALFVGCDSKPAWPPSASSLKKIQSNYDTALANATNSIPYASNFARLFPGNASSFSYYIGGAGPSSLNMEIFLFDRYQFGMKILVTFDEARRKVIAFGEPEFDLLEISEVGRAANGNLSINFNTEAFRRFGASEWKQIVDAGGDFSAIGYTFITNRPVPRFEELRKDWDVRMKKQP